MLFCLEACAGSARFAPGEVRSAPAGDLHADFATFLARHHRGAGELDYGAACRDSADLDRYLAALSALRPETDPERFPRDADRLAYWINGYNAWTIRFVLDHYPIESVQAVGTRWLRPLLPAGAGFFYFQRAELGGRSINLYDLENQLIRRRFAEPRIHFALNCASRGCPELPAKPFSGKDLDEELERETQHFLRQPENFEVDLRSSVIRLSAIFDWYERDFTEWLAEHHPELPETLQGYLLSQLGPADAARLRSCAQCRIEFVDYDWALNDAR